jgi:CBS domain-containing protein
MAEKLKRMKMDRFIKPQTPVSEIATMGDNIHSIDQNVRVAELLSTMLNRGIRRLPVIDKTDGSLKGIISTTDILDFLGAGPRHKIFLKKKVGLDVPIGDIMAANVYTVDMDQDISTAIGLFRNHDVGGLPVSSKGKCVGFLSESDIVKQITGSVKVKVEEVMTRKPFFIRDEYPVFDVSKIIVHGPYRRLPVVSKGILTGMVTPYDILKYLNTEKKLRSLRQNKSPIKKLMNPNVIYTKSRNWLHEAIATMHKRHVGGLPVVGGDEMDIVGIITERDVIDLLV